MIGNVRFVGIRKAILQSSKRPLNMKIKKLEGKSNLFVANI